jgi:hypothetical protein
MCQTISFSKSSRDAPAALASIIAFFARSSSMGSEAKMRSWSPKHAGTRSRQSIFRAPIILASLTPISSAPRFTAGAAGFHEESRTIMRRIAMDYDRLAKLAEVQLADQEAIERKT